MDRQHDAIPNLDQLERLYYQWKSTVLTHENNPEVTIACSDKLNEDGVKTVKAEKENVTNVKEEWGVCTNS